MVERRTAIDEWGDWRMALAENTGVDVDTVPLERRVAGSPAPVTPSLRGSRRSRLGQLMVERGMVTEEQLDTALDVASMTHP